MKTIEDFDACLAYINQIGAIPINRSFPGWIPRWQQQACHLADKLRDMAGVKTWFRKSFRPFSVTWRRDARKFTVYYPNGHVAGEVYAD